MKARKTISTLSLYEKNKQRMSSRMFLTKLFVSLLFSFVALYLNLLGFINFACLLLIVFGAFWNFFVDINTYLALVLCLLVSVIYGMFSAAEGFYVNAILYVMAYIPMQFITWITNIDNKDMSIEKDKKLDGNAIFYVSLFIFFFFSLGFMFALSHEYELLAIFDTVTACLLCLSAFFQSFMYREYYIIRPIAIISAIILWSFAIVLNGFSAVSLTMVILYSMYLIMDIANIIYWIKTVPILDKEVIENITEEGEKELDKEEVIKIQEEVEKINKEDQKNKKDVIA